MFQELLQPRKNGVFNHFLFVFILSLDSVGLNASLAQNVEAVKESRKKFNKNM